MSPPEVPLGLVAGPAAAAYHLRDALGAMLELASAPTAGAS